MTHSDISELFKKWFINQPRYNKWYLFPNSTGYASAEHVHYGLPPGGGGADFVCFGDGHTEFFEVKTIAYPTLSKKQKNFVKNMTAQGFKCWVCKELPSGEIYIIDARLYRPFAKWPYKSQGKN
jgi:hypothetical protein